MALGITAALTATANPRAVQVVVTGLTVGEDFEIRGEWVGGEWPVRAGTGVAEATQVVRIDIHTPVNVPVYYTVVSAGVAATSSALTVDYGRKYVLQALDGSMSVEFDMIRNNAPRSLAVRQVAFAISGRPSPLVRYDIAGGESGELVVDTDGDRSATLKAMLNSGAPLLLRTDGAVLDLAAVEHLSISSVGSALIGMTRRRWSLGFAVIDDPEPRTLVTSSNWDQFDASYEGVTWDGFDAEWSTLTWDSFDTEDFATRSGLAVSGFGFGESAYGDSPYGV